MRRRHPSPKLKAVLAHRASDMRQAPEWSELLLWQQLSAGKLGVRFVRQGVICRAIVDFVAPSARLVVEVDGPYHRRRLRADARRDAKLTRLGYRVLRLEAELVERDITEAVAKVRAALAEGVASGQGEGEVPP